MPPETVALRDHPTNLDPTATWVSGMHEPGMIFRVRGGFVGVLPDGSAFLDLFETETHARNAIGEVT